MTVVSGFLGAGKSTLVHRILTEDHGMRVLVVENELGDQVGIENVLVTEGVNRDTVTEFIELPNGCVCCTVKDELTDALSRVVKSGRGFDMVVIETSGMADPGPVASLFWLDEDLDLGLRLDGIITVVDAFHAPLHFEDAIFIKQIAFADLLLLNKVDLVTDEQLKNVEASIQSVAPTANLRRTSMAACDLREALHLDTLRQDKEPAVASRDPKGSSDEVHANIHDVGVSAITINFEPELNFDNTDLDRKLGLLIWERTAGEVWRMKAMVNVGEDNERWAYQGVHDLFEGNQYGSWGKMGPQTTFIFIGKHLEADVIRDTIRGAVSKAHHD